MIWTLTIKLITGRFASDDWATTVEIDASSTLDDLHEQILEAVSFDDDHIYEFYIARTHRSRQRIRFGKELDDDFGFGFGFDDNVKGTPWGTRLESLFPLPKNMKLFYLFDYGDNWVFQVSRTRKKPFEPEPKVQYPRLLSESGVKPEQYPAMDD